RGLKRIWVGDEVLWSGVAPRAGARIETGAVRAGKSKALVAPRAGARIETPDQTSWMAAPLASPLAQGRGLKHGRVEQHHVADRVAPRAGARIETASRSGTDGTARSRPSRRGA